VAQKTISRKDAKLAKKAKKRRAVRDYCRRERVTVTSRGLPSRRIFTLTTSPGFLPLSAG
jgi:hypothetical protein